MVSLAPPVAAAGVLASLALLSLPQMGVTGAQVGHSRHGENLSHGMPSVPREVGDFHCGTFLKGTLSLKVKSSL